MTPKMVTVTMHPTEITGSKDCCTQSGCGEENGGANKISCNRRKIATPNVVAAMKEVVTSKMVGITKMAVAPTLSTKKVVAPKPLAATILTAIAMRLQGSKAKLGYM